MWTAEAVLVCALTLLGRSAGSLPPVEFVTALPSDVSATAEAFVRVNDPHIYLVTTSALFRRLQTTTEKCGDLNAVRKLASVLIHEEAHVVQHADEADAYAAQLTTLAALGARPGNPVYTEVASAMRHARAQRRPVPVRVMVVR